MSATETPELNTLAHRTATVDDLAAKIASGHFGKIEKEERVPGVTDEPGAEPTPAAAEPKRDDEGKFAKDDDAAEKPADDAASAAKPAVQAPEVVTTPAGEIVLRGPWGERKLDPTKEADRATLVEFGQKGANYELLMSQYDEKVAARANEVAEQKLFEAYFKAGLVEVGADGQTKYTAKGLQALLNQGQPGTGQSADAQSDELDRLVTEAIESRDPAKAKEALKAALSKVRGTDPDAVRQQVETLLAARDTAATAQRRQEDTRTAARVKFNAALEQHPVLKEYPGAITETREKLHEKLVEFDRRRAARDPAVPTDNDAAFDLALTEVVGGIARRCDDHKKSVVQAYAVQAGKPARQAPPATGGGSAAPPAGVAQPPKKPQFGDRGFLSHISADIARRARELAGT